jgi:hypothetical protein
LRRFACFSAALSGDATGHADARDHQTDDETGACESAALTVVLAPGLSSGGG